MNKAEILETIKNVRNETCNKLEKTPEIKIIKRIYDALEEGVSGIDENDPRFEIIAKTLILAAAVQVTIVTDIPIDKLFQNGGIVKTNSNKKVGEYPY